MYRSNDLIKTLTPLMVLLAAACAPKPVVVGGADNKPIKFEDITLQNAFTHVPSGQEYIEGTGTGRPPEDEKRMDLRRKGSRDAAIIEAEKQLIAKLTKLVPRDQIRDLLKKSEMGKLEYTYDDGCIVTLRIQKELVVGHKPLLDE